MINADFEIERLRASLRARGFFEEDINQICRAASVEIGQAISDALGSALQEAADAGQEIQADDFISELRSVALNNDFYITTDSGNLDFSEPPFPMMSHLLKNPKVAKDGSLYKVIPVGGKSGTGKNNFTDLASVQQNINNARNAAADSTSTSSNVHTGPATFSGTYAAQKVSARNDTVRKSQATKGTSVSFKTVSSKQDPLKNWVQPAKDRDMTNTVNTINIKLRETIDDIIVATVRKYEEAI